MNGTLENQNNKPTLEQRIDNLKPQPTDEQDTAISRVEMCSSKDVFGDKAIKLYDGLAVYGMIQEKEQRIAFYSIPDGEFYNPRSKFASFVKKYGDKPRKGLTVRVQFNDKGYVNILL